MKFMINTDELPEEIEAQDLEEAREKVLQEIDIQYKCFRCGEIAEAETEQGWFLCSDCECIFNNIINEPNEKRTLKDFEKEFKFK